MARQNVRKTAPKAHESQLTHGGIRAASISAEQELRRSVMSCLLWEREFYENGEDIATRIYNLAQKVAPTTVADIAIEARENGKLRHAPLMLLSGLAKRGAGSPLVAATIGRVIQRADELGEFLAVHAKANGVPLRAQNNSLSPGFKHVLSAQIKKGIALAFQKFDEYQLAKYDRDGEVRLRDALFLSHAKPKDEAQAALWKRLIEKELLIPDTWETNLSSGADKRETFERLIEEGKLGYLALLRNLRNMVQAGCDQNLVRKAILARKGAHRVLPFRYVAAARIVPQFEPELDQALIASIREMAPLPGKTVVLVDVSGSMDMVLSDKSDLRRIDAAAALAAIIPGMKRVFTFSNRVVEVPPRSGMAGIDAVIKSQSHGGTDFRAGMATVNQLNRGASAYDRLIAITDEQTQTQPEKSNATHSYVINVGSYQRGIGYGGNTVHIDGFSESVIRFIGEHEGLPANDNEEFDIEMDAVA